MPKLVQTGMMGAHLGTESDADRFRRSIVGLSIACYACSSCKRGLNPVPSHGLMVDPHYPGQGGEPGCVMVIAEVPTCDDVRRKPSTVTGVRAALKGFGCDPDLVYVTHLVKCGHEAPDQESVRSCRPFLDLEFEAVKPKLVVTVGESVFRAAFGDGEWKPGGAIKVGRHKVCQVNRPEDLGSVARLAVRWSFGT